MMILSKNNLFLFFCFAVQILFAQDNSHVSGLIMDDAQYEQEPREPKYPGSKYDNVPLKVDLKPYCPEVGNQGSIESCVGWAVGYSALTIERAIQNGWTDKAKITENANSALFIYNQVKEGEDCSSGAKIPSAVQLVIDSGDCLSHHFDGDPDNCDKLPDQTIRKEANYYVMSDYLTLFSSEDEPDLKVLKVQRALANKKPVVIGMKVRKNFYNLKNAKTWWPDNGNTTYAGGHAMVVVGYNEFNKAFQIMNSWGTEWGENGFIWVKYKDFGKYCQYAFILHLGKTENSAYKTIDLQVDDVPTRSQIVADPTERADYSDFQDSTSYLGGKFNFNYLDTETMAFKTADLSFNGYYYKVKKTDWDMGQFFQLEAISDTANEYVYVFSIDANGKLNIHWPRQEVLSDHFLGLNESPLVLSAGSVITIPDVDSGLQLTTKGVDHLCILFSAMKIDNFKAVCEYMADDKYNFYNNLTALLKGFTVPPSEIFFDKDKIQFATSSTNGYVVPIVLELDAR